MRLFYLSILIFLLGCAQDDVSLSEASSSSGQGGSLARFTIIDNYLYTLETNQLDWYELQADGEPSAVGSIQLNEGKETIFPLDNLLFVGATDGMSIFAIEANGEPVLQGEIQHFLACDPVVANNTHAYVTLRQESCGGFFGNNQSRNVLNIYDVNDLNNPQWIAQYDMIDPRGLGLAGDILFVCEGEAGLRTLDVSDPLEVQFLAFKQDIHANDVIVLADRLLVIGPDNITQFDYSDPANLIKFRKLKLSRRLYTVVGAAEYLAQLLQVIQGHFIDHLHKHIHLQPLSTTLFLLLFLGLMHTCPLAAQSSALEQIDRQQPRLVIKHSLVHWMDPYLPGPYVELEHRMKETRYWRHQVGYISDFGFGGQIAVNNLSGIRLRTGMRKYQRAIIPNADVPFWELSFDYRYIDILMEGDFWRDNFNFQQRLNYNLWQHSMSLNFIYGFSAGIGPRWRLDIGLGAGVRLNHRDYSDLPDDARFDTNGGLLWAYNTRNGWEFALSVPVILSLGIAIF